MIVRRGALTDHYVEEQRSVVMVDESVLGLSPIATAILQAVPEGVTASLRTVTEHVVATFGLPEGPESAEALTEQQIWDLVAHRVLVVVEDERSMPDASAQAGEPLLAPAGDDPEDAVSALRDALRHLRSDDRRRWAAPDSLSSRGLVDAARQHHVVPYLAANLDRLDIPGQARSELEVAAGRQRAGAAVLAADLSVALDVLEAAGVRALAIKGVALASQAYGDYAIRGAGDLDLLVSPADLAVAHQVLSGAGWLPDAGSPVPGPSWSWRHFVRTGYEATLSGGSSVIDLHWHLVPTRGTFPDFDTLWGRREVVTVGNHLAPTLSRYDALTHSAGHASKDGWRWMRSLLDVHALISDSDTWMGADRPLRGDQLVSVGLAAREFGTPVGAAPVVGWAAKQIDGPLLTRVRSAHVDTAPEHRPLPTPGAEFLMRAQSVRLTEGSMRETARLISRSTMPPWLTAELTTPHAALAVPMVLARRARDLVGKLSRTARGRSGQE